MNFQLTKSSHHSQDAFMENYLASQRDHVFSNVAVLIYVFDIESREFDRDVITYSNCMRALKEYSSDARVFVLIHKMDLVQDTYRQKLFTERSNLITERSEGFKIDTYPTSIWDQSLYKAWAGIIYTLIPNVTKIEKLLQELLEHIDAEEIVLFERTTFLVVTSVTSKIGKMNPTKDRFERLSNIIKTFKQGVAKNTNQPRSSPQFEKMEIKTQKFSLFIQQLTTNTYALCVVPPGEKTLNMAKVNVEIARTNFEELDVMSRNYKNTKKPDDSLQDMLAGTEKLDIGSGDEGDKAEAKRAAKARKNARDRARKKAKAKAKGKGKALDEDSPEAGTTTEAETGTDELETEADTDADADAEADDADEFDAEAKV